MLEKRLFAMRVVSFSLLALVADIIVTYICNV